MSWFGKITFGSLGLFLGGPLGAVLGAVVGHHLVDRQKEGLLRQTSFGQAEQAQAAYFVCIFSILGKIASADGAASQTERAVVDNFINTMNVSEQEKQFARQVFNESMSSAYSIDDFARQFYQINHGQPQVLVSFLDVLFRVAAADGTLHASEETALRRVKAVFGISDTQYEHIRASYFNDLDKYYKILNCSPDSSVDEIKTNYKKLVKDFHPDTIVSKGLPEEFSEFAASRFREIQEAYGKIRKERNF